MFQGAPPSAGLFVLELIQSKVETLSQRLPHPIAMDGVNAENAGASFGRALSRWEMVSVALTRETGI